MNAKVVVMFVMLVMVTLTTGRPQTADSSPPVRYNFDWGVLDAESGQNFGHSEAREADFTSGQYYVQLPDGRRQMVTYRVDGDSGFVVDVNYLR
ncbi:pro-resilin [Hyalella azteca]|nr:pro-resilin [Hyalella azteca]